MPSYFTFTFRLRPWEYCLHLNFDRRELAPGFGAVCVRDHLWISCRGETEQYEVARAIALHLARTLIHSHAYCSYPGGTLLDVEPLIWSELKDSEVRETVFGYMHPSLETAQFQPGHPDNTPMLLAADVARGIHGSPSLWFALADFHVARREPVPYYAFYAYRVLEDVGFMFGTVDDHPDWDVMNAAFKTKKEHWDLLIDAGTRARHLNEQKLRELAAMDSQELLNLSHKALTLVLEQRGVIPKR